MKYLFERKFLIYLTLGVLVVVGISGVYQMFFFKSRTKDIASAISNAYIVKQKDGISETIFDIATQHDYKNYVFKGYKSGCYLGLENKEILPLIDDFIIFGKTRIFKRENDSLIYFINESDTMSVIFNVNKQNKVLYNGRRVF